MGCKCRQAKKIGEMLTGKEYKPSVLTRILVGFIVLVVSLLLLPLGLICFYIMFVIKGSFNIKIPNLARKINGENG